MSSTTAAQFARLKLQHPRWQLSRSDPTALMPGTFIAVERSTGRRIITEELGDFIDRLNQADWAGER
jgi:hypothetical protein